jgi:phosphate starvation-inducible PhoH-like protein
MENTELNIPVEQVVNDIEKPLRSKERKISTKPVTFHIQLTKEQKEAKAVILTSVLTVLQGRPGTAKSTLACNAALDRLIKGHVDQIIITRPFVAVGKDIGFLPGDAFDIKAGKAAPYAYPMLDTMYQLRGPEEIDEMIKKEKIVLVPTQFMRGRNFRNCFVIVDESQNLTYEELKLITTRICDNCIMVFTSDVNQIDLAYKGNSAAHFFGAIKHLPGVEVVELKENFRHKLALDIMDNIDDYLEQRVNAA